MCAFTFKSVLLFFYIARAHVYIHLLKRSRLFKYHRSSNDIFPPTPLVGGCTLRKVDKEITHGMIDEIVPSYCVFLNRVVDTIYSMIHFYECSKVLYPSPFIISPRPIIHVPKYLPLTETIVIYIADGHVILD